MKKQCKTSTELLVSLPHKCFGRDSPEMILRSKTFTYNRAINHVGEEKRTKTEIVFWRLRTIYKF